jgi:hypothetical protein
MPELCVRYVFLTLWFGDGSPEDGEQTPKRVGTTSLTM